VFLLFSVSMWMILIFLIYYFTIVNDYVLSFLFEFCLG
jgi:hypothetical protein